MLRDEEFADWYGDCCVRTLRWRTTALRRAEAALDRAAQ
eukprot:gene5077-41151_t